MSDMVGFQHKLHCNNMVKMHTVTTSKKQKKQ